MRYDQIDRGQTPFDFMLGFSIFIMAVVFIFMMAPGLITPFSEGQSADPLFADRTADYLSESKLVDSPATAELNTTKADEFFDQNNDELYSSIGADEHMRVHVEIEGPVVDYEVGPNYPDDNNQVTITQRKVSKDNKLHWLYVRVW
ncbi:DUF7287 family protein [Natronococcus wangiae]|uniref:DUF7287 family protein n=1 Tax=Natronococcus wangiae TaxID=3068275 RepID=UPI00273EAB27|nr:hypothetical protein [Natronococcus sp. AD5]